MPAIVLVGAQWGDEGKGKATDTLGPRVDYVVKFNGGNNAGHTVVIGAEKYALHLLPSGILTEGVTPVIGNGVVIDLGVLFVEIDALESRGVDTSRLLISSNAHIIAPYNRTIDKVTERFLGKRQIGTTGRGIGPTYSDKMNRVGLRVQDLFDPHILAQKVEGALDQKNHLLVKVYNRRAITVEETVEELLSYAERRDGRTAAEGRRRVRHDNGPPPALRLVRHGGRSVRGAGERADRPGAHEAGRPHRDRTDPGVRGLSGRRHPVRGDAR